MHRAPHPHIDTIQRNHGVTACHYATRVPLLPITRPVCKEKAMITSSRFGRPADWRRNVTTRPADWLRG